MCSTCAIKKDGMFACYWNTYVTVLGKLLLLSVQLLFNQKIFCQHSTNMPFIIILTSLWVIRSWVFAPSVHSFICSPLTFPGSLSRWADLSATSTEDERWPRSLQSYWTCRTERCRKRQTAWSEFHCRAPSK